MIELDGIAGRLVILPPDAEADHLGAVITMAGIDAVVVDQATAPNAALDLLIRVFCAPPIEPVSDEPLPRARTEWVLMTSGTTGMPKMVIHDFAGLTTAMRASSPADGATVWGTFYDIRRYGGLQMYFRAVCGGASLVLSSAAEPVADHLRRLAEHGVTHISGTPSQWRRALMIPEIRAIAPRYVRLSGEIADQAILDGLGATFPQAAIGHAYASTEAGVALMLTTALPAFPRPMSDHPRRCGSRSHLTAHCRSARAEPQFGYLGGDAALADADGFVDTGDIVERRGDRYYFAGRRGGIINIGGLKVHPEEVEAVINRHPQVKMSLSVRGEIRHRRNRGRRCGAQWWKGSAATADELKDDILKLCRQTLPRHKVPAAISFVPALKVAATGKLLRRQR